MDEYKTSIVEKVIISVIAICFVVWSTVFIYKSSVVGIDGKRYFCLIDDAMISMRYAWNFSHGLGLVWNPGEYIEGYSNPLMTLIMSLATLIFNKSIAVLCIQILGVAFILGIAYLLMQIACHVVENEVHRYQMFIRILSFTCALSYYPLVYWSLEGMETGLLTLLLFLSILSALNYTRKHNRSQLFLMAICLGLAFLTRMDSGIFALLTFLFVLIETYKVKSAKTDITQIVSASGVYALFVAGLLAFRLAYYGELFPNTYILKLTGMSTVARIRNGIGFVMPFLKVSTFPLLLASADLIFSFQKKKLFLLSLALAAIGYQIWIGGEPWNYWRIMSPVMPIVFLLFVRAVTVIVSILSKTTFYKDYLLPNTIFPGRYVAQLIVIILTLIGLWKANSQFLKEIFFVSNPYTTSENKNHVNTAIALNELTTDDATVGVIWAGAIPYYTGRVAIDFLGKCDRYIAHLPPETSDKVEWIGMRSIPGHNKYDLNYSIVKRRPTYVQDLAWGSQDVSEWAKKYYVEIQYKGVSLFLLKNSSAVHWGKADAPSLHHYVKDIP